AINPGLIYCSISAFGRTGPRKDGAGYEALMQAFSGIMSITGEPNGPPVRAGVSFLDLTTGIFSALGICNALLYRAKTGLGQRVDGSLLETAVTLLNYRAEGFLLTGTVPKALGSSHPSLAPYRNFRCRDGQWVFIAGANDRFWQRLVAALDIASLRDDKFATNLGRVRHRDQLEAAVSDAIGTYDREPLLKLLEECGVPATPVNTVEQVMSDPQTAARERIERVLHPKLGEIPVIGTPTKYSRMRPGVRRPAPLRGADHRRGPPQRGRAHLDCRHGRRPHRHLTRGDRPRGARGRGGAIGPGHRGQGHLDGDARDAPAPRRGRGADRPDRRRRPCAAVHVSRVGRGRRAPRSRRARRFHAQRGHGFRPRHAHTALTSRRVERRGAPAATRTS